MNCWNFCFTPVTEEKNRGEETVADDLDLSLEYVHRINELLSAYPMESDEEIVKRILC